VGQLISESPGFHWKYRTFVEKTGSETKHFKNGSELYHITSQIAGLHDHFNRDWLSIEAFIQPVKGN